MPESPLFLQQQRVRDRGFDSPSRSVPTPSRAPVSIRSVVSPSRSVPTSSRVPLPTMEILTPSRVPLPTTPPVLSRSTQGQVSSFAYSDPGIGRRRAYSPIRESSEHSDEVFAQAPMTGYTQYVEEKPRTTVPIVQFRHSRFAEIDRPANPEPPVQESDQESMYAHSWELRARQEPSTRDNSRVRTPQKPTNIDPTEPEDTTNVNPIQNDNLTDSSTLIEFDEELLNQRPYLVRNSDNEELEQEQAHMYYDRDWKAIKSNQPTHKYIVGKSPGARTTRHYTGHYYPIPIDPGDISNRTLESEVPRS